MYDNRTAAAEMLAEVDATESEVILRILGSEGQPISEILTAVGASKAVRITSLLANCRAAVVQNESIRPTQFGTLLYSWIMQDTRTDNAPREV